MPVFEIINPSDSYTIEGDLLPCVAATLLVGAGQYGLDGPGADSAPTMVFLMTEEDAERRLVEFFGEPFESWLRANKRAVGEALCTVLIGNREAYEAAIESLPDGTDIAGFRERWHDKHRSSLNDIGARAREIGLRFLEAAG